MILSRLMEAFPRVGQQGSKPNFSFQATHPFLSSQLASINSRVLQLLLIISLIQHLGTLKLKDIFKGAVLKAKATTSNDVTVCEF